MSQHFEAGGSWAAVAVVVCTLVASPAVGQTVDELVVTARKTEENLQDVPISISAFSGEQMRERGIQNNYDVAAFTPNFSTSQRVGRDLDRPTIRGMANPGSRGEPNASYFIDGVFVAASISTATTQSMERVEVLRGPQSAQFGRATFSGAVNYVTRKPSNEFETQLNVRYGTSDDRMLGGWVSGPVFTDKLLFLVSASYEEYGGQWNNNLQPDSAFVPGDSFLPTTQVFDGQNTQGDWSPLGAEETADILTKLTWLPFESTEINLKYNFTRGDDGHYPNNVFDTLNCFIPDDPAEPWYLTSTAEYCGPFRIDGTENRKNIPDLLNGLTVGAPLGGQLPDDELTAAPVQPGSRRDTHRLFGEWIQDIGEWTSVFRASYSKDEFDAGFDLDHQEVRAVWGLFAFHTATDTDDYSFEYSIASPVDRPIRGKLGVYYYDQERTFIQHSITGPGAVFGSSPGTKFGAPRVQGLTNQSVFGSLSFDLAEQWTLDIEARWAKDEKDITGGQRSEITGDPAPVSDSLSFNNFTPRFTLNFKPTEDMLLYGLIAKGNKPGGFNEEYFRSDIPSEFTAYLVNCQPGDPIGPGIPLDTECTEEQKAKLQFKEEEQWTYEVGIKSTWFDRSFMANLSVFYIDWANQGLFALDDVPQRGTGGTTPITILINAGTSKIIGLELETNWAINGGLSVFANYGYNKGEFEEGFNPEYGDTIGTDGDITGNTIPDSPAHSLVFGFEANAQASATMEAFLRGDFMGETKKYAGASNLNWIPERKMVNLRTGLRGDAWTATLYVRNLLNNDTPLAAFTFVNFATDPISTVNGAPNDGEPTLMYALNPQRGRDVGLEFQYRFGN